MDDNVLINFIKEQAAATGRIEQAVKDLDTRMTHAMPFVLNKCDALDTRVDALEKSGLKTQGFAAAVGAMGGGVAGFASSFIPAVLKKLGL